MGDEERPLEFGPAGGLSSRQREEQAERMAIVEPVAGGPKKGRKRRVALISAGVLLLLVGAAPTIAGFAGRGVVESQLSRALGGGVRIERLRLSWLGSQRVRSLRVVDGSLREVADVDVRIDRSLLGLALGWQNLGTITVSGRVTIDERGGPLGGGGGKGKAKAGEPARLPGSLRGTLRADGLDVLYRNTKGEESSLRELTGDVAFASGNGVTAALAGEIEHAGERSRIELTADAVGLTDAAGVLTPERATVTGGVRLTGAGLPAEALLGAGFDTGAYESALTFSLTADRGEASLRLDCSPAGGAIPIRYTRAEGGYRVELAGDAEVRADGALVAHLLPELGSLVERGGRLESGQEVRLDAVPGLWVRLSELGVTVRETGEVDAASLVCRGRMETDGLTGTLGDRAWAVEPMSLEVTTRGVDRGVALQAVTTATLGGQPAGIFVVNASAEGLLAALGESDGAARAERVLAGLRGGVEINDAQGAILDSLAGDFLRGAGLSIAEDLGSSVDAEIAFEGGDEQRLRLFLRSQNMSGSAGFVIDGSSVRSDGAGVRLEAGSLAGLLSRLLDLKGLALESGGRAELWVRDVAVDLAGLTREGGADLRALSGAAELRVEAMTGTLEIAGTPRALVVSPSAFSVDLSEIAAGASAAGALSIRVDGQEAGELALSVRATQIVDGRGAIMAGLPKIEGELTLRGLRTELAQPAAADTGLVLAEDLGPGLDVLVRADVLAGGEVAITADAKSERLTGRAELEIADRVLRAAGDGVSAELRGAGELVRRFVPEGYATTDGGAFTLRASELVLGLDGSGKPDWASARASVGLGVTGLWIRDAAGESLHAERLDAGASFDGGAGAGMLEISGVASMSGEPVPMGGQMRLTDLVQSGSLTLTRARLDGRIDLGAIPLVPARRATDAPASPGRDLAAELFGRLLDVSLVAEGESGDLTLGVRGERLDAELRTRRTGDDLAVLGGYARSEISPEVIEQMRLRAGQAEGRAQAVGARFIEPAKLDFSLGAFDVLKGWRFEPGGSADVRLEASGMVEGLPITRQGVSAESGPIGLESLAVQGRVPVGALLGGESGPVALAISGEVDTASGMVAQITGGLDAAISAGKLAGQVRADLRVEGLDAGLVDDVALLDGLVAGALGAKLDAGLTLRGEASGGGVSELDGELTLSSPRLSSRGAIVLAITPGAVTLSPGAALDWRIAPEFATRYLLSQPVGAERVLAQSETLASLTVAQLTLSRGAGPVMPGIFALEAELLAPAFEVLVPHEAQGMASAAIHRYEPVRLTLRGDASGITVEGLVQPVPAQRTPITLGATLTGFAGEGGELLTESAVLDGEVRLTDSPTAMIDALLAQDGLLAEALGPVASVVVKAQGLGLHGGSLDAFVQSTRASGRFIGKMFEGRLIAVEPAVVTVSEVRPELGAFIGEAVPAVGAVYKRPEDGPAILTITRLEVPLARTSELSRVQDLDIEATLDLGTARFQTSSLFSKVMKAAGQRADGGLGRKMSPIALTVNSGVLKYPRTKIPVGEFTIESEGAIRLTDGHVDVLTYLPMAALTDEALGNLKTGVFSALGRQIPLFESATMVPWRTRGLPGELSISADIQLMIENAGNALNPLDLINQGLGSLQDLVIERPKKKEGE